MKINKKWSTTRISFGTKNLFRTVYVNDLIEGVGSHISLFADDAKLLRKI